MDLRNQKIIQFSDLLKLEENFLINLIELDKGIGKNNLLKKKCIFIIFIINYNNTINYNR